MNPQKECDVSESLPDEWTEKLFCPKIKKGDGAGSVPDEMTERLGVRGKV
jgi:hypothetical protein